MDINTSIELLKRMPAGKSRYEWDNFAREQDGSFPRQLRSVLESAVALQSDRKHCLAEIDLLKYDASNEPDLVRAEILARLNQVQIDKLTLQIAAIDQELGYINGWLDEYDINQLNDIADQFEADEGDHWSQVIGKKMAVELLSIQHTTPESIGQSARLPLVDFKKAVIVTTQLATFIKDTTQETEATLYPAAADGLAGAASETPSA
jgi:hypothetical protein